LDNHTHRRAVNPVAAILSAIITWNIRPSTDEAMAALALEASLPTLLDVLAGLPVAAPLVSGVVAAGKREDDGKSEDDAVVSGDVTAVVAAGAVPATEAELAPPDGGGLASAGFASAPLPQGIFSPSG